MKVVMGEELEWTVSRLVDLCEKGALIINPEYQRGAVWNDRQMRMLIDSILRGYHVPLIYLRPVGGERDERYEIIDGQQRINTLFGFAKHVPVIEKRSRVRAGGVERDVVTKTLIPPLFVPENESRFPGFMRNRECPWGERCLTPCRKNIGKNF